MRAAAGCGCPSRRTREPESPRPLFRLVQASSGWPPVSMFDGLVCFGPGLQRYIVVGPCFLTSEDCLGVPARWPLADHKVLYIAPGAGEVSMSNGCKRARGRPEERRRHVARTAV